MKCPSCESNRYYQMIGEATSEDGSQVFDSDVSYTCFECGFFSEAPESLSKPPKYRLGTVDTQLLHEDDTDDPRPSEGKML